MQNDLTDMVFVLAASPRPIEARIVEPGEQESGLSCCQSLFGEQASKDEKEYLVCNVVSRLLSAGKQSSKKLNVRAHGIVWRMTAVAVSAGKPRGSQSVYNKAMWHLFHADDSSIDDKAEIVRIEEAILGEERAAARLRSALKMQAMSRDWLSVQVGLACLRDLSTWSISMSIFTCPALQDLDVSHFWKSLT